MTVRPLSFRVRSVNMPFPVAVTLVNRGRPLRGCLDVRIGGSDAKHTWRQHLNLGQGSFLYWTYPQVTQPYSDPVLRVRLVEGRKLVDAQSIPLRWATERYAVLAAPGRDRRLRMQPEGRRLVSLAPALNAAAFPDRWFGYRMFDAVLWDVSRTEPLSDTQQSALLAWIRAGGILLLGASKNDPSLWSPVPSVLPSLTPATGEHDAVRIREMPGGKDSGFAEKPVGLGRIRFITTDLADLASWKKNEMANLLTVADRPGTRTSDGKSLWDTILGTSNNRQRQRILSGYWDSAQYLRPSLARLSGYSLIGFGGILGLMLTYIALVSIVDYLVLRKLRRLPWTWLTFPSLIVVFSAVSFRMFYQGKMGPLTRNEITFEDVGMDGSGRSRSFVCVRSNANRPIRFTTSADDLLRPPSRTVLEHYYHDGDWGQNELSENWTAGGARQITIPARIASFRFFHEERPVAASVPPLDVEYRREADGSVSGKVVPRVEGKVLCGLLIHRGRYIDFDPRLRFSGRMKKFDEKKTVERMDSNYWHWQAGRNAEHLTDAESLCKPARCRVACEAILSRLGTPDEWLRENKLAHDAGLLQALSPHEGVAVLFLSEPLERGGIRGQRLRCIRQVVSTAGPGYPVPRGKNP